MHASSDEALCWATPLAADYRCCSTRGEPSRTNTESNTRADHVARVTARQSLLQIWQPGCRRRETVEMRCKPLRSCPQLSGPRSPRSSVYPASGPRVVPLQCENSFFHHFALFTVRPRGVSRAAVGTDFPTVVCVCLLSQHAGIRPFLNQSP